MALGRGRPRGAERDAVIDREKVLAVLVKRFPDARLCDVAAAANAIVGLEPEYAALSATEVTRFECEAGARHYSTRHLANGEVRVFCRGHTR
jgi:hypothetical protein